MKFTDAGKRLVATPAFALRLRNALNEFCGAGTADEEYGAISSGLLAWAATGHNIANDPTESQEDELADFVEAHHDELRAMRKVCEENLRIHEFGPEIH